MNERTVNLSMCEVVANGVTMRALRAAKRVASFVALEFACLGAHAFEKDGCSKAECNDGRDACKSCKADVHVQGAVLLQFGLRVTGGVIVSCERI